MRFLCFHGRGTNAKIFEMQTAKIREELPEHEFVFVSGSVPTEPFEGVASMANEFYGYLDERPTVEQCQGLLADLREFVARQGPFDGVMGFSEGGIVAATLLLEDQRRPFAGFKCAILMSASLPLDSDAVHSGELRCVRPAAGVVLGIPTAHIVGANEQFDRLCKLSPLAPLWSDVEDPSRLNRCLADLCEPHVRHEFIHKLGHQVPGAKGSEGLFGALRAIERTIESARAQQAC